MKWAVDVTQLKTLHHRITMEWRIKVSVVLLAFHFSIGNNWYRLQRIFIFCLGMERSMDVIEDSKSYSAS